MSVLLGFHMDGDRAIDILQDDAVVTFRDSGGPFPARSVVERRNGVIGNGITTGDGVFDFRYGPFTGGYPEAGVVHYYTYGERILSVEIDLSRKHRGIESSLGGKDAREAAASVAGLCGNFAAAHSVAYARAVESALGVVAPLCVRRFRIAALELERIYNHLYVIMRLATAAAQKVLAAHLAALFEETLRLSEALAGARGIGTSLTWGVPAVGSVDAEFTRRLEAVGAEFSKLYERSLDSRNYLDRLHGTATVDAVHAGERGLTGPSLRACDVATDLRVGEALISDFRIRTKGEADAFARMEVRAEELLDSVGIVVDQVARIDFRKLGSEADFLAKAVAGEGERNGRVTGLGSVESPTGTVAWLVVTDHGKISSVHVSSPSLFGFQAYADSIVGNIFTDVPFAVESFGVSFADAGR